MSAPYAHADEAIKRLNDAMGREFQNMSVSLRFDELNVIDVKKRVGAMYRRIDRMVRREFIRLARKVARDAAREIGADESGISWDDVMIALFAQYNPVTEYVYTREWARKRDRLVESLMASEGRLDLRQALKRALGLLALQVGQYGDNLTDEARREVFREAGVSEVMWNTQRDGKVCAECADRDMKIYPIDGVPGKHYYCRCYLTAVGR